MVKDVFDLLDQAEQQQRQQEIRNWVKYMDKGEKDFLGRLVTALSESPELLEKFKALHPPTP